MAEFSFDIVSKIDPMELQNAVNQADKELSQRYDFKGVGAKVELVPGGLTMEASSDERVKAVLDVLQSKLVRRGISLLSLEIGQVEIRGKVSHLSVALREGINGSDAKKITAIIKAEGPKSVKSSINGSEIRVTSKSRDDLQKTIGLLREAKLEIDLQFINYR